MKFVPEIELQSLEKIKSFQEEKLKSALVYLRDRSPFYKKLFAEHKIDVSTICSLEDLQQIPTTSKDDLQNFNWDFLCVPKNEIAEYTSTSGTMGRPVTIAWPIMNVFPSPVLPERQTISISLCLPSTGSSWQALLTIRVFTNWVLVLFASVPAFHPCNGKR